MTRSIVLTSLTAGHFPLTDRLAIHCFWGGPQANNFTIVQNPCSLRSLYPRPPTNTTRTASLGQLHDPVARSPDRGGIIQQVEVQLFRDPLRLRVDRVLTCRLKGLAWQKENTQLPGLAGQFREYLMSAHVISKSPDSLALDVPLLTCTRRDAPPDWSWGARLHISTTPYNPDSRHRHALFSISNTINIALSVYSPSCVLPTNLPLFRLST